MYKEVVVSEVLTGDHTRCIPKLTVPIDLPVSSVPGRGTPGTQTAPGHVKGETTDLKGWTLTVNRQDIQRTRGNLRICGQTIPLS